MNDDQPTITGAASSAPPFFGFLLVSLAIVAAYLYATGRLPGVWYILSGQNANASAPAAKSRITITPRSHPLPGVNPSAGGYFGPDSPAPNLSGGGGFGPNTGPTPDLTGGGGFDPSPIAPAPAGGGGFGITAGAVLPSQTAYDPTGYLPASVLQAGNVQSFESTYTIARAIGDDVDAMLSGAFGFQPNGQTMQNTDPGVTTGSQRSTQSSPIYVSSYLN